MNLKSWKTTAIGVIALIGLGFNAYTNGGFSVADFLLLITGIGFLAAKDGDKTNSSNPVGTKSNLTSKSIRKDDYHDIGGDGLAEDKRD